MMNNNHNLTLTSVVFELYIFICIIIANDNLTLTSVVFELSRLV